MCSSIIAPEVEGVSRMPDLVCPECEKVGNAQQIRVDTFGEIEVVGIIRCLKCRHEFPFSTS